MVGLRLDEKLKFVLGDMFALVDETLKLPFEEVEDPFGDGVD